jgi:hypothetical protein
MWKRHEGGVGGDQDHSRRGRSPAHGDSRPRSAHSPVVGDGDRVAAKGDLFECEHELHAQPGACEDERQDEDVADVVDYRSRQVRQR